MSALIEAALEFHTYAQGRGWRFCVIGGVALARWGAPRATQDVDLTLLTGFGNEETYIDALLERFRSRIPDARDFALRHRVLLLAASNGVGIDVSLAGLPFEAAVIERSSPFPFTPEASLRTCSAEDLIVLKAFAGRGQDWVDVENIILRQGDRLDWPRIVENIAPLCDLKGSPDTLERLERLRVAATDRDRD